MFKEPGLLHALLLALVVSALYALRKRLPGTQLGRRRDQFESPHAQRRRRQLIALECKELALAGVFFLVGGAKLIGRHDMVELFRSIGVGQWLRYVTGVLEVVGAAFMVIPLASGASAVALGTVMISATLIELFVLRRPPIAAMACLSAHTYVAWSRLLHRASGAQALTSPTMEPTPADPATMQPTTMVQTPADPPTMGPVDPPTVTLVSAASTDDIDPSGNMATPGTLETS
jgi:putative oxidoreductase